jgi:hypothetical protein
MIDLNHAYLILSELSICLEKGFNIFDRRVSLYVVCRAENKAPMGGEFLNPIFDFASDIFDNAVGHGFLDGDSTMERDVKAKVGFNGLVIHSGNVRLEGIEDVKSAIDKIRNEFINTTASMMSHLTAEFMSDVNEALETIF